MSPKLSFRFYGDHEVRAVWDEAGKQWWFAVVDVVGAVSGSKDARNYWNVLKSRFRKAGNETLTKCKRFRLEAADGKRRLTDCLPQKELVGLIEALPGRNGAPFIKWLVSGEDSLDVKSREKAYALFGNGLLAALKPGTAECLLQIHAYLFGGLYDFAGQIRTVNIAKGNFAFAPALFLENTLAQIERMPEGTFDEIVSKYVEMNVAHPFREGNGRATRIWLDLMLKANLKRCVDWSRIDKGAYLKAMTESPTDSRAIRALLCGALTDRIDSRELFMKGIDYSYYYESDDVALEPPQEGM